MAFWSAWSRAWRMRLDAGAGLIIQQARGLGITVPFMGGDGVPAVAAYGIDRLSLMRRYRLVSVQSVAEDLFESYVRHD